MTTTTTPVQLDSYVRIVSLANLEAMCQRISDGARRYQVIAASGTRVSVSFSVPSDHGAQEQLIAYLPVLEHINGTAICALRITHLVGDTFRGDGWDRFTALFECPAVFYCGDGWRTLGERKAS